MNATTNTNDTPLLGIKVPWPINRHIVVTKLTDFSVAIEKVLKIYKSGVKNSSYARIRIGKYAVSAIKPLKGQTLQRSIIDEIPYPGIYNHSFTAGFPLIGPFADEVYRRLTKVAENSPANDVDQPGYNTLEAGRLRNVLLNIFETKGTVDCPEYKKVRKFYERILKARVSTRTKVKSQTRAKTKTKSQTRAKTKTKKKVN